MKTVMAVFVALGMAFSIGLTAAGSAHAAIEAGELSTVSGNVGG